MNCLRKGEVPFKSLRFMLDEMNLKIDAMTSHGFDYRKIDVNNVNAEEGCKFCLGKGRSGMHHKDRCWFNPNSPSYRPNQSSKRKQTEEQTKELNMNKAKKGEILVNNVQTSEEVELPT